VFRFAGQTVACLKVFDIMQGRPCAVLMICSLARHSLARLITVHLHCQCSHVFLASRLPHLLVKHCNFGDSADTNRSSKCKW